MGMPKGGGIVGRSIQVIRCPGCGRLVRAVVYDGRVRGRCTIHGKYINAAAEDLVDNATRASGRR